MGAVFAAILKYVIPALTAIPQLVQGVESLWKGTPKSGAQKWIAVEQALSASIVTVAQEISQLAPNTPVDTVSAKVAIFSKAVNDAFVKLANDLGIFQTTS
jgi:hypothetical protein